MIDLSGEIVALRTAYEAADTAIVGRLDIAEPKITALETADVK